MTSSRVGMRREHRRHGVDQEPLAGERVQALHVQQQVARGDPELRARGALRLAVGRLELVGDRRIDDVERGPVEAERDAVVEQAAAVERDAPTRPDTPR